MAAIYDSTATYYASAAPRYTECAAKVPLGKLGSTMHDCCRFEVTSQGDFVDVSCYRIVCTENQDCLEVTPEKRIR